MSNEAASTTGPGSTAGAGSEPKKKIAGKFDSLEEAVEKGYTGLESAYHETRQELSAIRQLLEGNLTRVGERGRSEDQGYRRGQESAEEDFDATEFLAKPSQVLKRREDKLRKELGQEFASQAAYMVQNAMAVARFQAKNPDLDDHEELVTMFMGRTDPKASIDKRLKEAGKLAREYIAKLKAGEKRDAGRQPSNEEHVEAPAGNSDATGARAKAEESVEKSSDEELADEIVERKQFRASRFTAKTQK